MSGALGSASWMWIAAGKGKGSKQEEARVLLSTRTSPCRSVVAEIALERKVL